LTYFSCFFQLPAFGGFQARPQNAGGLVIGVPVLDLDTVILLDTKDAF